MVIDLTSLFQEQVDLFVLEEPFSHEEIDAVVSQMPTDKYPGPDGFNTDFVKKNVGQSSRKSFMLCAMLSIREKSV